MKRKITWVTCLLLACVLLAMPVFAAGSVSASLSAGSSSAGKGDTISFTVAAKVDACGSGSVVVSYDSSVFEMVSGECTVSGADLGYFDAATKDGGFAFSGTSAVNGSVFQFVLKVKDSAPAGSSKVNVTFTADGVSKSASASVTVSCNHSWDSGKVTKKATCDADGTKTYTCSKCGGTKTETIKATGHSYDSGKVTKEPTCTAKGTKTYTCATCGKTKTEEVKATGHSYDSGKVTKEPTCTAKGTKTYTCATCGTTKTEEVKATSHSYDSGKVTKEATCTEKGSKTYTCATCGKTKTEEVKATGHSYDGGKVTKEATCSEKGSKTYTCATCGKTKTESIEVLSHTYDHGCDTDCNVCGATRETAHAYEWASDGANHWKECTLCGDKSEAAPCTLPEELTWDEEQHGYLCETCGKYAQAEVHIFDNACDTLCEVCGYTREITHMYSDTWSSGKDGHWHECIICGDQLELVPHTPGDAATETTDQICLDCGYIIQVAGNHVHTMSNGWLSDESGHWFLCYCDTATDPEAHGWDEGIVDEANGTLTYTCTVCSYQRVEEYIAPTTEPTETVPTENPAQGRNWIESLFRILGGLDLATIVLAVLLVISVCCNFYLLHLLNAIRKRSGKYSKKTASHTEMAEPSDSADPATELPDVAEEEIESENDVIPEETEPTAEPVE